MRSIGMLVSTMVVLIIGVAVILPVINTLSTEMSKPHNTSSNKPESEFDKLLKGFESSGATKTLLQLLPVFVGISLIIIVVSMLGGSSSSEEYSNGELGSSFDSDEGDEEDEEEEPDSEEETTGSTLKAWVDEKNNDNDPYKHQYKLLNTKDASDESNDTKQQSIDEKLLKKRYARGEITKEEYAKRKKNL